MVYESPKSKCEESGKHYTQNQNVRKEVNIEKQLVHSQKQHKYKKKLNKIISKVT